MYISMEYLIMCALHWPYSVLNGTNITPTSNEFIPSECRASVIVNLDCNIERH
uniref:Uncharacterized protein n=1 Tax=Anguilla anguilla TaxID=7936 RepID=A0A0E9UE34_ANGAN